MKKPNEYRIQKRKDGRFSAVITENGYHYYIYGKTQKEVRGKLKYKIDVLTEAKMNSVDYMSSQTTLYTWAKCCVETYSKTYVRPNTYASYCGIIETHLGELGNKKICDINNLMIQKHLSGLMSADGRRPLGISMVKNVRTFLSMIFNYAITNNILLRNPVKGVRLPEIEYKKPRSLTLEEQAALIRTVREYPNPIMFAVILDLFTGLRKGEVLAIQWQDIDFENKRILINKQLNRHYNMKQDTPGKSILELTKPKTTKSNRYAYLFDSLFDELTEYMVKRIKWKNENGFQHSETDFLFSNSINAPIEPRRFYQYYEELLKLAGIENANFHTLRHTYTTRCIEAGIDIVIVSKMLGHASIKLTADTYSHLLEKHNQEAVKLISELFLP